MNRIKNINLDERRGSSLHAKHNFFQSKLTINDPDNKLRGLEGLLAAKYENLSLIGYQSHGKIAAPVAV